MKNFAQSIGNGIARLARRLAWKTGPAEDISEAVSGAAIPFASSSPPVPSSDAGFPAPIPHPSALRIDRLCQDLRRRGRFLPAWEAMGMRVFLERLCECAPLVLEASEEGVDALDWFERFLDALPVLVSFDEAAPESHGAHAELIPLSSTARFDNRSIALHRRAAQVMRQSPHLSYGEALRRASQ